LVSARSTDDETGLHKQSSAHFGARLLFVCLLEDRRDLQDRALQARPDIDILWADHRQEVSRPPPRGSTGSSAVW